MAKIVAFLCVLLLLGTVRGDICPDELESAIIDLMGNCSQCERAYWGIRVEQLLGDMTWGTLYALNDNKYLSPASNNKILTTSAAFHVLGPEFTITTPVYLSNSGDLCLVGHGDPSISFTDLQSLAKTISTGLFRVRNVYLDNDYYVGDSNLPQNWEWSDITAYYGAAATPLIVDENTVYFQISPTSVGQLVSANFTYASDSNLLQFIVSATTTDTTVESNIQVNIFPENYNQIYISGSMPIGSSQITIPIAAIDPALRFASLWENALLSNNITITGKVAVQACNPGGAAGWKLVGSLTSPTLAEMMNYTLQTSDNLYAETFLRQLGKTSTQSIDTAQAGKDMVRSVLLNDFGVANDSFYQDDGSGLSRQNLVSPQSIIETLTQMYFMPNGSMYFTFLPVAGESGTLAYRFVNTPAQGILHAKTGTLTGVNALSGMIKHQDTAHPVLLFSIIANNAYGSSTPRLDDIGVLLASVKNC